MQLRPPEGITYPFPVNEAPSVLRKTRISEGSTFVVTKPGVVCSASLRGLHCVTSLHNERRKGGSCLPILRVPT